MVSILFMRGGERALREREILHSLLITKWNQYTTIIKPCPIQSKEETLEERFLHKGQDQTSIHKSFGLSHLPKDKAPQGRSLDNHHSRPNIKKI
ncbi:unnamed protein product [Cochlearia groenlandica]